MDLNNDYSTDDESFNNSGEGDVTKVIQREQSESSIDFKESDENDTPEEQVADFIKESKILEDISFNEDRINNKLQSDNVSLDTVAAAEILGTISQGVQDNKQRTKTYSSKQISGTRLEPGELSDENFVSPFIGKSNRNEKDDNKIKVYTN
ncbi:unnamed protein product [[Candida] boidinii]|nr:unnamed protein product [[Candida] boidinii]